MSSVHGKELPARGRGSPLLIDPRPHQYFFSAEGRYCVVYICARLQSPLASIDATKPTKTQHATALKVLIFSVRLELLCEAACVLLQLQNHDKIMNKKIAHELSQRVSTTRFLQCCGGMHTARMERPLSPNMSYLTVVKPSRRVPVTVANRECWWNAEEYNFFFSKRSFQTAPITGFGQNGTKKGTKTGQKWDQNRT